QERKAHADLVGVCCTDANTGVTVGQFGVIRRTTDGGSHWVPQSSGISELLAGVSFTDTNNGMISGDLGIILRTTDGGETWVRESTPTEYALGSISSTGSTAVGYGGAILRRVGSAPTPTPNPTATVTPTATTTPTVTPSATPIPTLCDNGIIQNGGFETGNFMGWTIDGNNETPVVTNTNVHSGTFSAFAGSASGGFCGFGFETPGDSS